MIIAQTHPFPQGSSGADIEGNYRYRLWREVATPDTLEFTKILLWCMLNPSKATATKGDHTVTKVIEFTRRFGFHVAMVVNIYAYRATNPRDLIGLVDREGPSNREFIEHCALQCDTIIVAWGKPPSALKISRQAEMVLQLLEKQGKPIYCLGKTKEGYPRHPLRIPYSSQLQPYP